jgi:erythrin-vacuolar iron transport family protein
MIDQTTTPEEAVRMAIDRERKAHIFYTQAAKIAKYPGTKQMFEELAKEELSHLQRLEDELDKEYMKDV